MSAKNLHALPDAARLLGGISIWTLRKHITCGNVAVVRLGRRVFMRDEEIERIREAGLPPLSAVINGIRHLRDDAISNTNNQSQAINQPIK
jgi:hypothetical protein